MSKKFSDSLKSILSLVFACGRSRARAAFAVFAMVTLIAGGGIPTKSSAANPTKITFALDYTYDGGYAPFFIALARGYYKDAGIDVSFVPGQGSSDAIQKVGVGIAEAGSASAVNLLLGAGRDANIGVVATAVWLRHAPFAIETLKESNITSIGQLRGKTIGEPPAGTIGILDAMMQKANLPPGSITKIAMSPAIIRQTLLQGKIDSSLAYGHLFADITDKVNFIYARSLGIDPYGTLTIFNKTFLAAHPDVAKAFNAATIRGLRDTLADPEAGAEAVAKVAGSGTAYYLSEIKYLKDYWDGPDIRKTGYLRMSTVGWDASQDLSVKFLGQEKPLSAEELKQLWVNP